MKEKNEDNIMKEKNDIHWEQERAEHVASNIIINLQNIIYKCKMGCKYGFCISN